MRNMKHIPALFTLTAGALCVSSALAQSTSTATTEGAQPAVSGSEEVGKLETVVVTAQRRAQVISKVPMSVAAMNSTALEKQSVRDVTDISRAIPGMTASIPDPAGETNISIRGISSVVGAATTGVYIDDVPVQINNVSGCFVLCVGSPTPKIFDIDRVEVLRGPQGTLYGSSSLGGALRFITTAPKLRGELTGSAHAEMFTSKGGAPGGELGVVLDAPLSTDVAGFRLSLWSQHAGGYVDAYSPTTGAPTDTNINSSDSKVARLAVKFTPTDKLTITPSYYYQNLKQSDRATYTESLGIDKTLANIRQPNHDHFGIGALTVDYDFDSVALKAIVSNLRRTEERTDDYSNFGEGREYLNNLNFPASFPLYFLSQPLPKQKGMGTANSLTRNTQDTSTIELRLTSTDSKESRLSWIGGVYLQAAKQGYIQNINEDVAAVSSIYNVLWYPAPVYYPGGGNVSYTADSTFKTTEQALYGEVSYKLQPSLTASAGLRVTRITSELNTALGGWWNGGPGTFTGQSEEHPVTPKLGLSYQATADSLYYGTASKGFRAGGANMPLDNNLSCHADLVNLGGAGVEPSVYKSDSVWSYEFGSKQTLANGAVQVSGSLYRINWTGVQTQVMLPTCGFGYIDNMGKATSKGFDLQIVGKATKDLTLSASLGYNKAQYTQSVANAGHAVNPYAAMYLVKDGDPLPTPERTAALGAEYGWQWAGVGKAFARADYQFASGYYSAGSAGTQGYDADTRYVSALHMVNLRAGLKSGAWDYSVYIKNALNDRTEMSRSHPYSASIITGLPSQYYFGNALAPRTIGISTNYRF